VPETVRSGTSEKTPPTDRQNRQNRQNRQTTNPPTHPDLIEEHVGVLNLVGDVYLIVKYSGNQRASGIGSAVVALIVLYLLYGCKASKESFARA
jgi:hypothetical protein